jgi:hypothetical protein
MHRKIGQLLSEIVPLSTHDLEDILQEQKTTRQRFGDAALSLGMVQPEHVWQAWVRQIESECTEIDLDELGVDTQTIDRLPGSIENQYRVIPVRQTEGRMVIACAASLDEISKQQIQNRLPKHEVIFVLARPGQVEHLLRSQFANQSAHAA